MSLGDSVPRRRGADTTAGSSIILSCRNISITIPSVDSDLLAAEYQSRVLLDQAACEACLSEFHFHRLFRADFGETRTIFSLACAWTAPSRCSLLSPA